MNAGTPAEPGRVPRPRAGRDRPHLFPGRPRGVNARFTDDEYAELATAADKAGLTPTGFCAQAALDAARGLDTNTAERVERQTLSSLQAELFQARTTVNQLRTELAQHLDAVNPTTAHVDEIVTGAAHLLTDLDGAISRIHHRLGRNRTGDH
jgi:uncharacterized protein (DUF1778 family)